MIVLHVCLVVHFVYFHSKYCLISFKFWMHHKNALHVCLLIHFLCVCDRTGGKKTAAPNKISKRNLPFKVTVKKCDKVEKTWALALDKLMFKCPTLLLVSCVCLGFITKPSHAAMTMLTWEQIPSVCQDMCSNMGGTGNSLCQWKEQRIHREVISNLHGRWKKAL